MAVLGTGKRSGSIRYPYSKPDSTSSGSNGGGGTGGGGTIWSGSDQIIWISTGGVKYPIHLKPGKNDISFWIPALFPEDTWIECPLVIEAPGYILIPAGFKFDIFTGEDAPVGPGSLNIADKLSIVDFYDIDIAEVPVPPKPPADLDNITDEYGFNDFITTDIININISEASYIDDISLRDDSSTDSIKVVISNNNTIDNTGFEDFVDIDTE